MPIKPQVQRPTLLSTHTPHSDLLCASLQHSVHGASYCTTQARPTTCICLFTLLPTNPFPSSNPGIPSDTLNFTTDTTHVCVLCLNRWYRFELLIPDSATGVQRVLSAPEVARKLYAIKADAEAKDARYGSALPVQVLTSQDRSVANYCTPCPMFSPNNREDQFRLYLDPKNVIAGCWTHIIVFASASLLF